VKNYIIGALIATIIALSGKTGTGAKRSANPRHLLMADSDSLNSLIFFPRCVIRISSVLVGIEFMGLKMKIKEADMPNGRPGDHPLTDIVNHHIETYSKRADDTVRDLSVLLSNKFLWRFLYHFHRKDDVITVMGSKRRIPILEFEEMLDDLYKKISSLDPKDPKGFEDEADRLLQDVINRYGGKIPR